MASLSKGTVVILGLVGGMVAYPELPRQAWSNISVLDDSCYITVGRYAPEVSGPLCGGVSKVIQGVEQGVGHLYTEAGVLYYSTFGQAKAERISDLMGSARDRLSQFASSSAVLEQMMERGPSTAGASSGSPIESYQDSINNFVIAQSYLREGSSASMAIPWLQRGARDNQGYGAMSQLTLGNMYLNGAPGLTANPAIAQSYLLQARNSIGLLKASDSEQAKRMLQAMGGDPNALTMQIEAMIRQIKTAK